MFPTTQDASLELENREESPSREGDATTSALLQIESMHSLHVPFSIYNLTNPIKKKKRVKKERESENL